MRKNNYSIDLHGLDSDEALFELDKFINESIMNNNDIIKVIHGKGRGVLKNKIYEYLSESVLVKKYENAGLFDNYGTTVVELIRI